MYIGHNSKSVQCHINCQIKHSITAEECLLGFCFGSLCAFGSGKSRGLARSRAHIRVSASESPWEWVSAFPSWHFSLLAQIIVHVRPLQIKAQNIGEKLYRDCWFLEWNCRKHSLRGLESKLPRNFYFKSISWNHWQATWACLCHRMPWPIPQWQSSPLGSTFTVEGSSKDTSQG